MSRVRDSSGQAVVLMLGALVAIALGAIVLGGVALGIGRGGERQRAADLAALAGARAMRTAYARVFEPAVLDGRPNPRHLERAAYLALGRRAAEATARRNGAERVAVGFASRGLAPVRIRVTVADPIRVVGGELRHRAVAVAELAPPGSLGGLDAGGAGQYRGPFAERQGKRMRPDVALAFDRMARAAAADGVGLVIVSAFRSDAEQAVLFARHPDPKWVAPPGRSLHRLGTELDLGPSSAYRWLAAHAPAFHFKQRYSWACCTFRAGCSSQRSGGGSSGFTSFGHSSLSAWTTPSFAIGPTITTRPSPEPAVALVEAHLLEELPEARLTSAMVPASSRRPATAVRKALPRSSIASVSTSAGTLARASSAARRRRSAAS